MNLIKNIKLFIMKKQKKPLEAYMKILIMAWIVYFINYLGRYNYSAAMLGIGKAEGYLPTQLGAIVSILFIAYGSGQLISGFIGDLVNPVFPIAFGITGTGICNLLMAFSGSPLSMKIIWGVNGFCSAMIWAPLLKQLTLCMPPDMLRGSIISIQYACAMGICFTYLFTSAILVFFSWRTVFLISSILILSASIGWIIVSIKTKDKYVVQDYKKHVTSENKKDNSFFALYISSGLVLLLLVTMIMGFMKDGIMTWVPKVINDTFGISASLAVFLSAALPLINLFGIKAVKFLNQKTKNNDVLMSLLLFFLAFIFMLLLSFTSKIHPLWTISVFSAVSASVFGINTILISFISLRFAPFGRTSTVSGVLNSATYAGSAISGWGLGYIAENFGWGHVNWILVSLCGGSVILCALVLPLWNRFLTRIKSFAES